MTDPAVGLGAFVGELRRRRVVRVLVVYAVVGWLLIQVADTVAPHLGLPPWLPGLVIVLVALGFPLGAVLAWAYDVTPEGVRRTLPANVAQTLWPQRALPVAALGIAVALPLAFLMLAHPGSGPVAAPHEAEPTSSGVLAILPFTVRGDAALRDLGAGMVSLLGTKMDGAGELRTVDARALLSTLEREGVGGLGPFEARSVALRFGAGQYVLGEILHVEGRLRLTAGLYSVADGAAPLVAAAAEGTAADLFSLVDELAAQLLGGMEGGPSARVRRIAAVTTHSLPALRAFLAGERLARGAQFGAAVEAFQRAVAEDTTFALAYYRLAMAAEWNLQDELARSAAERLVPHADRLAERDRRMLEAFLVRRRGANAEAERLYRSILGTYPDEFEAWVDLQEVLFHAGPLSGRSFTGSREALERTLAMDPAHATSLIHLARVAAFEGSEEEVRGLAATFLALNPDADRAFEMRALRAFALGNEATKAEILREGDRAEDLSVALAVWSTAVYVRDLEGALELSRRLTLPARSGEARTVGHAWAAHLLLATGRLEAARSELQALSTWNPGAAAEYGALLAVLPFLPRDPERETEALDALERLDPETIPLSRSPSVIFTAHDALHPLLRDYLRGLLLARLGRTGEARVMARAMERHQLPRTAGSLAQDLAQSVRASAALRDGRPGEALALLEGARMETWYGQTLASPYFAQVLERFIRAELLVAVGREEEALPWFAHMAELSPFELPYLAVAEARQAGIHEAAGRFDEARAHRERARRLWEACDPELCALLGAGDGR